MVGGAEIAAALGEVWKELGLLQIVPSIPLATGAVEEYNYTLVTRGGERITWGGAPGAVAHGELPAAEKVALLKQYSQQHGTLEGAGRAGELDLHRLRLSSRPNP